MSEMIDLAIGRACHFCGDRNTRNERVRRQPGDQSLEELVVPLCARHQLLLQSAGPRGRLYKATGERWWSAPGGGVPDSVARGAAGCPAESLLR